MPPPAPTPALNQFHLIAFPNPPVSQPAYGPVIQVRACLYKVQIAINIASYRSGNETSKADINTVHKCLGNTDLSIRLCFRLADCIFIPWQISHLRSAAVLRISCGSSRNAPGMSASVSAVVTEAWSVENYQQPGTVLVTRAQDKLRK